MNYTETQTAPPSVDPPTLGAVVRICYGCVERMGALGLKGKKRDDETLAYLCGAATALHTVDNKAAALHLEILVFLASVRGYAGIYNFVTSHPEYVA